MTRNRSISLRLHIGRHKAHYALVHRTDDGRAHTDRRLSWGQLELPPSDDDPQDVLELLERAVRDLRRRHGRPPPPEAGREPRGAVGGGPQYPADAPQLRLVSDAGVTLDGALPED